MTIEKGLRKALETDQLELYYQPQVKADGNIYGAEALVRWQ
ncbi:EAL domain-containing protein, partial [Thiolapillus sp.]